MGGMNNIKRVGCAGCPSIDSLSTKKEPSNCTITQQEKEQIEKENVQIEVVNGKIGEKNFDEVVKIINNPSTSARVRDISAENLVNAVHTDFPTQEQLTNTRQILGQLDDLVLGRLAEKHLECLDALIYKSFEKYFDQKKNNPTFSQTIGLISKVEDKDLRLHYTKMCIEKILSSSLNNDFSASYLGDFIHKADVSHVLVKIINEAQGLQPTYELLDKIEPFLKSAREKHSFIFFGEKRAFERIRKTAFDKLLGYSKEDGFCDKEKLEILKKLAESAGGRTKQKECARLADAYLKDTNASFVVANSDAFKSLISNAPIKGRQITYYGGVSSRAELVQRFIEVVKDKNKITKDLVSNLPLDSQKKILGCLINKDLENGLINLLEQDLSVVGFSNARLASHIVDLCSLSPAEKD